MTPVSDIKLIRTNTTLDLSQKAEEGILSRTPKTIYPQTAFQGRKPYGTDPVTWPALPKTREITILQRQYFSQLVWSITQLVGLLALTDVLH